MYYIEEIDKTFFLANKIIEVNVHETFFFSLVCINAICSTFLHVYSSHALRSPKVRGKKCFSNSLDWTGIRAPNLFSVVLRN